MPSIHTFDDTVDGYTSAQTSNEIKSGDVLVIPSEGVIGFLYEAWPVAVIFEGDEHGDFHVASPPNDDPEHPLNKYKDSVNKALDVAESDAGITGSDHWREPKVKGWVDGTAVELDWSR